MHRAEHLKTESLYDMVPKGKDEVLDAAQILPYIKDPSHLKYLENESFHEYIMMEKTATTQEGAEDLLRIGASLEEEYMPRYIHTAAWAYAEVGLMDASRPAVERNSFITHAEDLWRRALIRESEFQESEYKEAFDEPEALYRHAVPLAYTSLMKSIAAGSVPESMLQQALRDTVAIASSVAHEIERARAEGDIQTVGGFVGLAHELNALSMLLYMDDPRYIPFPSTARADTGYYHRTQSHDIMIINQHWGAIRKVIPVEIKARPSQRDRKRYKALLVRGKMHLTASGADPRETIYAFRDMQERRSSVSDTASIEKMSTELREMLRLYGKGVPLGSAELQGGMRFYESEALHRAHPEIAPSK